MDAKHMVLTVSTVLVLAACGGSSTATIASSSAATSQAPSSAAPSVDAATAGVVCAAVNALVFDGHSGADAIATAASAYKVTQAQVVYAINHRCPALKRIVPAG